MFIYNVIYYIMIIYHFVNHYLKYELPNILMKLIYFLYTLKDANIMLSLLLNIF